MAPVTVGVRGRYLTTTEAAGLMGLHRKTVQTMCSAGQIECLWNGREGAGCRYKVHSSVVEAWIRRHTKKAVAA